VDARDRLTRALLPPAALPAAIAPRTLDQALQHTLVFGNDGRVLKRVAAYRDATDTVQQLACNEPLQFFRAQPQAPRLAIYVHGGLNSEADSLLRVRIMAPYFQANGIYPLFITWKTGVLETLRDIIADHLERLPPAARPLWDRLRELAAEAMDRSIEVLTGPIAKPLWSEMKQNALAALEPGRGLDLLALALRQLSLQLPDLQIHLVAHSAGSIVLGQLLTLFSAQGLQARSCHLYAPACTLRFALDSYLPAFECGTLAATDTHLHLLSDRRERADSVGLYRKSLLYLVSRALEEHHKTPLLGMEITHFSTPGRIWHPAEVDSVRQWQALSPAYSPSIHIIDSEQIFTGRYGRPVRAAHGNFDNDAELLTTTLQDVRGALLTYPVEWLEY
jgi:hypothetical protein